MEPESSILGSLPDPTTELHAAQHQHITPALPPAPKPVVPSFRNFGDTQRTRQLIFDNVLQADEGADLGFLRGKRGSFVPRDNH